METLPYTKPLDHEVERIRATRMSGVAKNEEKSHSRAPRVDDPLTAERARLLLNYDPNTGVFTHKVSKRGGVKAGEEAGYITRDGYRVIGVDGTQRLAHRIAILMTCGEWPSSLVDHINGVRADNRIANLRLVDAWQNATNRSGVSGASIHPCGKWQSKIGVRGKCVWLGLFETREAAEAAYWAASERLHGAYGARTENERDARRVNAGRQWDDGSAA